MKKLLLSLCFSVAMLFSTVPAFAALEGEPDFSSVISAQSGEAFSWDKISSSRKTVLAYVDPSCPHCQREVAEIEKNIASFQNVNLVFVSYADSAEVLKFLNGHPGISASTNVVVLQDQSPYSLMRSLNIQGVPTLLIYSAKRELENRFDGETPVAKIIPAL